MKKVNSSNTSTLRNGLIYDLSHQDLIEDIKFYIEQTIECKGKCLEVGCGTGRVTIPIQKNGVDIIGLDPSTSMLSRAKEKEPSIEWMKGTAENFSVPEKFDIILMPFRVIQLIYDLSTLEKAFENICKHLKPEGKLIFDIFNPCIENMKTSPKPKQENCSFKEPETGAEILVEDKRHYDQATQINHITFYYTNRKNNETQEDFLKMRCFFPQEMDFIVQHLGFKILHKYGDFDESEFTSKSPQQIFICRKK